MTKEQFDKLRNSIIKKIEDLNHITVELESGEKIMTDESDIGNMIGISFGKVMDELGLDKNDFISGVKHGISIQDGSHSIRKFIDLYGTEVKDDEDSAYVELMMDDHICIEFEGVQYYIPQNHVLYSKEDEKTLSYLNNNHHV